jgi:hypothetical protein
MTAKKRRRFFLETSGVIYQQHGHPLMVAAVWSKFRRCLINGEHEEPDLLLNLQQRCAQAASCPENAPGAALSGHLNTVRRVQTTPALGVRSVPPRNGFFRVEDARPWPL